MNRPYELQLYELRAIILPRNVGGGAYDAPKSEDISMIKILFVCHGTTLISPEIPPKTT